MKKQKLFVAGLLNDNFYEAYYIIDLAQRESKEIIIDNTCEQANIIKLIKKQFSNRKLPYGAKNVKQFMPYLINPHSCYKIGDKMLSFMLQAPYFREIDINTLENNLVTYRDLDDITFSASSIGQSEDGCIYLSINSANARADIYNGIKSDMGFEYYVYDVINKKFIKCANVEGGLIDNMHQVGYSQNGFLVSLDMNISVDIGEDLTSLNGVEARLEYQNAKFIKGKIFLWDINKEKLFVIDPPSYTPAHVEFDMNDQSIFYASCHNMSKFGGSMVLHGPGKIVKYQYTNGEVCELGSYSEKEFNRITTHKLFYCCQKPFLAVTGYPNYLYIIDAETMELVEKIKLFEAEYPVIYEEGLFQCVGNRNAPLYLQVSEDGRNVYLVNSDTCYDVSWLESKVESFQYTDKNFGVSAHIEIF